MSVQEPFRLEIPIDPVFWEALCLWQLYLLMGFRAEQIDVTPRATTVGPADSLFPERTWPLSTVCVLVTLRDGEGHSFTLCVGPAPYEPADRDRIWRQLVSAWIDQGEAVRPFWEQSRVCARSGQIEQALRKKGFRSPGQELVVLH